MLAGRKQKSILIVYVSSIAVAILFGINWCYHVYRKPSELVGLADSRFYKRPQETWRVYQEPFQQYSTSIITPEFLAALAQTETSGNTVARTYWRWNFSARSILNVYAPASSAVGLFQITDGTFAEAKHNCVRNGQVLSEYSKPHSCYFNDFYNRLIPSHSIEMTSAYLHLNVVKVLKTAPEVQVTGTVLRPTFRVQDGIFKAVPANRTLRVHGNTGRTRHQRHFSLEKKQELAAIIHLCGIKRGEAFVARRFRFLSGEKCGAFNVKEYVLRVQKLQKVFVAIHRRREPLRSFNVASGRKI